MLKFIERCITDRNFTFLLKAEPQFSAAGRIVERGLPEVEAVGTVPEEAALPDELLSSVLTDAGGKIRAICPPAKKQNEKKNKRINGL